MAYLVAGLYLLLAVAELWAARGRLAVWKPSSSGEFRTKSKRLDELVRPAWLKKLADADRVIKSRKGVMPPAEYRLISAALHPDQSTSKQRMHEAPLAFTKHELPLVAEKELPIPPAADAAQLRGVDAYAR